MTTTADNTQSANTVANPTSTAVDEIEVSVVIPCLNEARSIGICIDKALASFATAKIPGEVVVADNGSSDGSIEIAIQHGARVIHVAQRGYGNALRAGIEGAKGDFIMTRDADDSNSPDAMSGAPSARSHFLTALCCMGIVEYDLIFAPLFLEIAFSPSVCSMRLR